MPALAFGFDHCRRSLTGPPRRPFYMDGFFTLVELDTALRKCNKHSALGPENVSYLTLRNLDDQSRFRFFNA